MIVPVPLERLESIAALASLPTPTPAKPSSNSGTGSSLEALLRDKGIPFRPQPPDARGFTWYHVERCPFHDDGQPFECGLGQKLPDGPLAGHCFHPEGQGKGWQEWKFALGLAVASAPAPAALQGHAAVGRSAPAPAGTRITREEVLAAFHKWLFVSDPEALEVLMATAIAIHLPGDPLWLYYVGPSGGAKTEPLRALSGPDVVTLSSLTPQTLISGYKGDPAKLDLLPKLDGKLLVIKDFTSILSKKPEDTAAIFADLRETYDGYLEKSFGSGVGTKGYRARFGLIAAVTPVIDRLRTVHSLLGERFLRIDVLSKPQESIQRASQLEGQEAAMRVELRQVVASYLAQAGEWTDPAVLVEQRLLDQLRALAHVTATLRSEVDRDRQRVVRYDPVPEVGTRLVKQLQKLAKALANWRERVVVAAEDYLTVRRVALDCVRRQRRKVVGLLQQASGRDLTTAQISAGARLPADTAKEVCEDLWLLGVAVRSGQPNTGWKWALTKEFRETLERAAVDLHQEPLP